MAHVKKVSLTPIPVYILETMILRNRIKSHENAYYVLLDEKCAKKSKLRGPVSKARAWLL